MSNKLNSAIKEEDTQRGKFLSFQLGNETYAIEMAAVIEIVNIQSITFVPNVPDFVKGIINLRGKVVPVIDMRLKFKKTEQVYNERTCIIILEVNEIVIGIIIDKVCDVLNIADEQISAMPNLNSTNHSEFIKNIANMGNGAVLILDVEKLF